MDTTIFKSKKYVTNSIFIKKALSRSEEAHV